MAPVSVKSARDFVAKAKIPPPRRPEPKAKSGRAGVSLPVTADLKLDETKDQAVVVGSTRGVDYVKGLDLT